jgi:hypothetical protein
MNTEKVKPEYMDAFVDAIWKLLETCENPNEALLTYVTVGGRMLNHVATDTDEAHEIVGHIATTLHRAISNGVVNDSKAATDENVLKD